MINRETELTALKKFLSTRDPELIVMYGRRRGSKQEKISWSKLDIFLVLKQIPHLWLDKIETGEKWEVNKPLTTI